LLFWFLSVQLRSDVQHLRADLPRSDAVRLTEFVAIPMPLRYICQLLFWFLSVQLRSDVQRLRADLPRSDAVRLSPTCTYNLTAAECCNQRSP
jgi:hypothetical protein